MFITRAKVGRKQVEIFIGERKTKLGAEDSIVITVEDVVRLLKEKDEQTE